MSAQSQRDALHIRRAIIQMLEKAGSGHAAGALGLADVFAVLYRDVLKHDPKNPAWENRDRVLLSNGHVCPVWYATLALHGYFPEKLLTTLRTFGSPLQGHPHQEVTLGIENTSGPLGQGISLAMGRALAAKLKAKTHHLYVVTSDGEHQEGQTWEAYLTGAKYDLQNVTVIIDRNYIQISGVTEQVMPLESLPEKIASFGWAVLEVDGHDHQAIQTALEKARDDQRPTAVVLYTEPGRGVDFMESKFSWHGSPPSAQEARSALQQLNSLNGLLGTQYD